MTVDTQKAPEVPRWQNEVSTAPGKVVNAIDKVDRTFYAITQVTLLCMCFIIALDVVLRYFFKSPTPWGFEVAGYMLAASAVLPAGHIQRLHGHVRVTLLYDRMPKIGKKILNTIILLGMLFYTLVMVWRGTIMSMQSLARNAHASTQMAPPLFYLEVLIPLGFLVFALAILADMYRMLTARDQCGEG